MNITLRQLKAFLLTSQYQSFSRAAEHLFITQSGMSVLIRELEVQLGARLLERTTRKVTLTSFGAVFLPIASRAVLDLEEAAANIGRSASAASHRLVIGATPLVASKLLPAAIGEYAKRDPGLQLVLHDGEFAQLVDMVKSGALHIALGCCMHPVSGIRRTSLCRFALMAVRSEADAARLARPVRWEDLVGARLLGGPPDSSVQQVVDRHLQRLGRRDPPDMVLHCFETQIAMVEAGAGIAVIPSYAIPACRAHRVSIQVLRDPVIPVDLVQIADRGRKLPQGADAFIDFLKGYIVEWSEPWSPRLARAA